MTPDFINPDDCLAGGGDAGAVMRSIDWSQTPLGPVAAWPESLRVMVGVMLASRFAMRIIWGPGLIFLYNDGYRPILGEKHPAAMGSPAQETFREVWPIVGPLFERVFDGESIARQDILLPLNRNGYLEECYFTLSYSPIRVADRIGGVLGVVAETTERVVAERRLRALRELAGHVAVCRTTEEACAAAASSLVADPADAPFVLFYLSEHDGTIARLTHAAGLPQDSPAAPSVLPLGDAAGAWPLLPAGESRRSWRVDDVARRFGEIHAGPAPEPIRAAMVLPLTRAGLAYPYGFMVAGLNPRRALDDRYSGFFELAAEQVVAALGNVLAREHSEAERRRLHSFLMQAPAAVAIVRGPALVFEFANHRCRASVGGRRLVGRPAREALPELQQQGIWDLVERIYATGEAYVARDCPIRINRHGTGVLEEWYFNWSGQATRDVHGRIDGVMLFALDVTDQVNARQHVEESRAREEELRVAAEAANRAKDEFLAMLGHELRNPLAPITTALHLMKLRDGGAVTRERIVIERQVEHLSRLVDDLFDVSRITRGKIDLARKRLEIADVIADAIEMASPLLEQRQHHLTLDVPSHGLAVHGDATRLGQVVSNLLTNAAKYTEVGGRISVSASRDDDAVVIRVADNGIGITAEMLPSIFELFVQDGQALDRSRGGLGLGLAIVRSLVDLHGGTVSAASAGKDLGSEFTVRLPALPDGPAVASSAGVSRDDDPAVGRTPLRILVVDDNQDAAELLASSLGFLGYEAHTAHDGPSALRLAEDVQPDVALLDIGLPVMDGYELATRLRESAMLQGLHLIAVTGYGREADRRRSAAAGFDAHVVKPLQMPLLEHMLREFAAGRAAGGTFRSGIDEG
jgi:signal transduction histidine kinase/ActR/RegA family two-component response regulator